jgi:hypothetical protein
VAINDRVLALSVPGAAPGSIHATDWGQYCPLSLRTRGWETVLRRCRTASSSAGLSACEVAPHLF